MFRSLIIIIAAAALLILGSVVSEAYQQQPIIEPLPRATDMMGMDVYRWHDGLCRNAQYRVVRCPQQLQPLIDKPR